MPRSGRARGAELEKLVATAPQTAAPSVSSLDDEVARPLEAPIGSTNIDEIRKEGLTGRQLRMARRTAQRHDLPATSDFDAVRLLRQAGIDPFQRSNLLELAPKSSGNPPPMAKSGRASRPQLPQRLGASENLPALITEDDPALRRAREVERIQQSIIRRRQKKLALLGLRLAFFVGLPTLLAGWYFTRWPPRCIRQNLPLRFNKIANNPQAGGIDGNDLWRGGIRFK